MEANIKRPAALITRHAVPPRGANPTACREVVAKHNIQGELEAEAATPPEAEERRGQELDGGEAQ